MKASLNFRSILLAAMTLGQYALQFNPPQKDFVHRTRGQVKPKQGSSNPLRGYYSRYSHVLTPMMPEINHNNSLKRNKLKRERRAANK